MTVYTEVMKRTSLLLFLTLTSLSILLVIYLNITNTKILITSQLDQYTVDFTNNNKFLYIELFEDILGKEILNPETNRTEKINKIVIILAKEELPLYKVFSEEKVIQSTDYYIKNSTIYFEVYLDNTLLSRRNRNNIFMSNLALIMKSVVNSGNVFESSGEFTQNYIDLSQKINTFKTNEVLVSINTK